MEDLPENSYETKMYLHENESLDSKLLNKSYVVTFICEDDNNFKIIANDDDVNYIFHFRLCHYVNMKEKDFIYKINNFKLLLETVEIGINKNRVTLCNIGGNLKITFYYTNIYEEKKISFELHEQLSDEEEKKLIGLYYAESEEINETKNNIDYRAEIVKYNKNFEDYGDRNIIRATIRNTGTTTWEREVASLQCVPEFSSLLCKEYFFEHEVIPGEDVEIALEFLKNERENLEPPYFTCMHLHIHPQNFDPMLVFDFNNSFINKKTEDKSGIKFKEKEKYNKKIITGNKINIINDNDNDNNNQINFINDDNNNNKINFINDDNNNKINFINDDNSNKKINTKNDDNESKNNINKDIKKTDEKEINKTKKIEKKEIKKTEPQKNTLNDVEDDDEEEKLKKMTPVQRRIYLLNKNVNKGIQKEKEKEKKVGWRKQF